MRFLSLALAAGLMTLGLGCNSNSSAPPPTDSKSARMGAQEAMQLTGTWTVTAMEAGGSPVAADNVKSIQYVFDGDKVTVRRPDEPETTAPFSLDPTANPKTITFNFTPQSVKGIYSLEGNKLRLCLMMDDKPGAGFPTEMASKASPRTNLLTLERK